jgi:hypothetical protein
VIRARLSPSRFTPMLKPSNFITFTVPNFLQGIELNTPGFDNVQRSCEALKTQYQAIVPTSISMLWMTRFDRPPPCLT